MTYTQEEIVSYARSQIRFLEMQKGKKLVLGFMGGGIIVNIILVIQMIHEKSKRIGGVLFQDERFLEGIAAGIMFIICVGFSALCFIRMFSNMYGKEIAVHKLLVKLVDGQSNK